MPTSNDSHSAQAENSKTAQLSQEERDLNTIRSIITERAFAQDKIERESRARQEVGKVLTEALNDRQQKDGSVGKIMRPMIDESMQSSMRQYQKQFTDYLYPLVGQLARKYTIQILRDFIEKTNEVIENSFSFRSIGWRIKAWRAGVSYRHFVASQTFVFQIKQILLIHKETGLLLNSVSVDSKDDENSDLISSMLTAINDFVSDSFSFTDNPNEQQLDEVKTDDFTLHIRQGSKAVLVAAVEGTISPKAKYKLHSTLEEIHTIYMPQLVDFDGNSEGFVTTRDYLYDCLISEQKSRPKKKKSPIFALALLLLLAIFLGYWALLSFKTNKLIGVIEKLPQDQGISLTRAKVEGIKNISLYVLRDPRAITVEDWLRIGNVNTDWLKITEAPYISLAPAVIEGSLANVIRQYPELSYSPASKEITGKLGISQHFAFTQALEKIQGIETLGITQSLDIKTSNAEEADANQIAMTSIAGKISQLQVDFELASAEISSSERQKLIQLAAQFKQLQAYAELNGLRTALLILGASDNTGDPMVNQQLSIERAMNTKTVLFSLGINESDMLVSGLGVVDVANEPINIRKAILNIVYNPR